jgi:hypothetical protein
MTAQVQKRLSFVMMAVVVFVGMTLLLWGGISTGPHTYFELGFPGWLTLRRYGDTWSFDHIDVVALIVQIAVAVLLTRILARIYDGLRRRKTLA